MDRNGKKAKKSMFSYENLGLCVAELIGTALLLFIGCMGCITEYESMPVPHYMSALSFGLTVMLIIQCFGHISGAHLNPAVTMVTVILGILDISVAPMYLIGQFAGAVLGLGALKMLVPAEYVAQEIYDARSNTTTSRLGLCTTAPHPKVSTMQALVIETVITAVLILVCCAIWDKRNEQKQDSVPLRFGLVIATIAIAAGPFSGASMNTARSFAPALLNGDWKDQWIYWVGPTAGGLLAVFFYKGLYSLPKEKPSANAGEELQELRTTNEK